MKTLLLMLCAAALPLVMARGDDDELKTLRQELWRHPHVEGVTLQTADGRIWLRFHAKVLVVTKIPDDLLIADGTHVIIPVDRETLKLQQFENKDGRVHTLMTVEANGPPKIPKR